jgi:cell division protein FtsB
MKDKMKKQIFGTVTKIASSIPLSCVIIAVAAMAVGVVFHNWHLAGGIVAVAIWPVAPALMIGPFCDTPAFIGQYKAIVMNAEFTPEGFAEAIRNLEAQINAMLGGLPPLEQYEAASELSYGMRCLRNSAANLITMSSSLSEAVKAYAAKVASQAEASAEAKLLEKGDYIKKTDSEAAVKAAAELKEKEVKDGIEAADAAKTKVLAARAKLVEDKTCTLAVANALPPDFFKEEGYADRVAKLTARLKKLTDDKLTADEFVAEMAALPLDEAGDKIFESRVKSVKSLVASSASRGAGGTQTNPLAVGAGKDTEQVLIF